MVKFRGSKHAFKVKADKEQVPVSCLIWQAVKFQFYVFGEVYISQKWSKNLKPFRLVF